MKHFIVLSLFSIVLFIFIFLNKSNVNNNKLNIYNWSDYIADGVIEKFEEENTSKTVQKLSAPDDFDWDNMKGKFNVIGSTCYIHVKNDNWKSRIEMEEEDEKKMDDIPDLD